MPRRGGPRGSDINLPFTLHNFAASRANLAGMDATNQLASVFARWVFPDAGIEASRPDEQAGPLVFLCSDAASHVSGEILIVDAGFTGSGITGAYETAAMAVEFMENM